MKKVILSRALIALIIVFILLLSYRIIDQTRLKHIQETLFDIQWPVALSNYTDDQIVQFLGEPKDTETADNDRVYLVYDHFRVLCTDKGTNRLYFGSIYITDPYFELWRGKLRIGSSRTEVEQAYRGFRCEMDIYEDLYWYVGFIYDENDLVKGISLCH